MAAANKFDCLVRDTVNGVHAGAFGTASPSDVLKIYLTNVTPNAASHSLKSDVAEIGQSGGYAGAQSIGLGRSQSSGIITLTAQDVVFTSDGSSPSFPPFQNVVLCNDSAPNDPVMVWWEYGQILQLEASETFTVDFGASLATIQ